jgi:hypothetical protein
MSNVGDLTGGEGDHLIVAVMPKNYVEVVEIPAGGAENKDALHETPP